MTPRYAESAQFIYTQYKDFDRWPHWCLECCNTGVTVSSLDAPNGRADIENDYDYEDILIGEPAGVPPF